MLEATVKESNIAKEGTTMLWDKEKGALRQRPQAAKLPACIDKMSKESSAPRNEQQTKASTNVIQGAKGPFVGGSITHKALT